MRKTFFILLTFITTVLATYAKDGVSVSEATVSKGNAGTITLALDNDSYTFTAFSFKLTLPEGLSFITDSEGKPTFTPGDRYSDHGFGSNVSGQTATFTCFSINTRPITGTSGTILTINIQADATLEVGAELTATLSELTFSTTEAQEVNFDDLPFTVTITELRVLLDENSTTMPEAATGVDVLVKRTIKANGWSTICLPFAMTGEQATDAFGANAELADFSGYEIEEDEETGDIVGILVNFTSLNIENGMAANHPYVIKINTEENVTQFTVDGVDIQPSSRPIVGTTRTGRLIGTYEAETEVPEFSLFLSDNKFWYSLGATKMKAFRAYFTFRDLLTEVEDAYANIRFVVDDASGIQDIELEGVSTPEGWYTIDGRKLNGKPAQKGIYIKDGVKVRL